MPRQGHPEDEEEANCLDLKTWENWNYKCKGSKKWKWTTGVKDDSKICPGHLDTPSAEQVKRVGVFHLPNGCRFSNDLIWHARTFNLRALVLAGNMLFWGLPLMSSLYDVVVFIGNHQHVFPPFRVLKTNRLHWRCQRIPCARLLRCLHMWSQSSVSSSSVKMVCLHAPVALLWMQDDLDNRLNGLPE